MIDRNLKTVRGFYGLTAKELAKKSGIHAATISLIESGKVEPTFSTLQKLADALGVDIQLFFAPRLTIQPELKEAG